MIIIKSKIAPDPDFKAQVIVTGDSMERFAKAIANDDVYMQHLVDKYNNSLSRKEKIA